MSTNRLAVESLRDRVQFLFDDPAGELLDDSAEDRKEAAAKYWAELTAWADELNIDIWKVVDEESTEYERQRMEEEYGITRDDV